MIPIVTHSIRVLFNISANKKGVWAIFLLRYKLRNVRVCSYHSGLVFDGANLCLSDRTEFLQSFRNQHEPYLF